VYLVGSTDTAGFPVVGGFQSSLRGASDAFVAKLDPTGSNLLWSSYLGGSGNENAWSLAVRPNGQVIVVGSTGSADYPLLGGFDTNFGYNLDGFLTQIDQPAPPPPAPPPSTFSRLRASNGVSDVTYRFQFSGDWTWKRVWIDGDRNAQTGFSTTALGIGAEYLIENGALWRYTGTGGTSWSWALVRTASQVTGVVDGMNFIKWTIPLSDLGTTRDTNVVFHVDGSGGSSFSAPYRHIYTTTDPASPILGYYAENDSSKIYYHAEIGPSFAWKHVFIDADQNATTGWKIGGIGAEFMIENGRLYKYGGSGWSWMDVGDAHLVVSGTSHDWWIYRTDIGKTGSSDKTTILFHGSGGGVADTLSAPYPHIFTP
jgi:hypothetical protein